MKLNNLFKDNNDLNEKTVVGFWAFVIMVIFALADIVTSILGMPFVVNEFIYSSFTFIVLGSFGINEMSKVFLDWSKGGSKQKTQDEMDNKK